MINKDWEQCCNMAWKDCMGLWVSEKSCKTLFSKHTFFFFFFPKEDEMICIQTPCYLLRGRKGGKKKGKGKWSPR